MSRIATFVAATTEEIHQTWRDYVRYVDAQRALLDAPEDAHAAFEQDDAGADGAAQARAVLAAIPASRRAVFDTVLEQERQRALVAAETAYQAEGGRGPIDPQGIEQAVLQQLHDEAHGIGTPTPGRGLVPLSPEEGDWYEVDVAALEDAPQAGAYLLRAVDGDERRRGFIQAGIVGGVAVVTLFVWLLWPSGDTQLIADIAVAPAVGDAVVEPWPLRQLLLTTGTTTTTVPISVTTAAVWPPVDEDAEPLAFWQAPALLPLRLCVPASLLDGATTVQLHGDAGPPVRHYTLATTRPPQPDLVLKACQDAVLPPRYGSLMEVTSPPEQPLGAVLALANTTLTVTTISAVGLGEDPTLPVDRQRVEVAVQTSQPFDWATFAPTLLLLDGQALAPSAIDATLEGAVLRYLVPTSDQPRQVIWQITPADASPLRWRVTLPVPPDRLAILRERLAIEQATIIAQDDTSVTVELTLRNLGTTPLALSNKDVTATEQEQPIVLPQLAALQFPLAPEEQRTLSLALPRPLLGATLILALGPYRYAIGDGREVMLSE